MTNHQELSERLAELLGIEAYRLEVDDLYEGSFYNASTKLWLTQDSARMFELIVDCDVHVKTLRGCVIARDSEDNYLWAVDVADYTNKYEATRVALAHAIIKKLEK